MATQQLLFLILPIIVYNVIVIVKSDGITFKDVSLRKDHYFRFTTIKSSNSLKDHLPEEHFTFLTVIGKIPILYENSVSNISIVENLEFYKNELEEIRPGAFKNLIMKKLTIGKNKFTTLNDNIFDNVTIETLDLGFNKISTISSGALKNLPRLKKLLLWHNKLETLQDGVFDNLEDLEYLKLTDNQISTLPEKIFRNLSNLQMVFLGSNQLGTIQKTIFENSSIQLVDLDTNSISVLPENVFEGLRIRKIILANNDITTISKGVFNNQNLEQVDLNNNTISFIDPEAFDNMTQLAEINLANNNLARYDPYWFHNDPNILKLSLSHNKIEVLPDKAFGNIYNQNEQWLELDGNKIKKISPGAFKGFKKIKTLDLKGNLIEEWKEGFLADAEIVGLVDLTNNKLTCVEGNFDNIFKANFTYLFDNPLSDECLQRIKQWESEHPPKIVWASLSDRPLIHL